MSDEDYHVFGTEEGQSFTDQQPLRIGPPRFRASAHGLGIIEAIDPIAVDATLNAAECTDEDCDCDHQKVYLLMIEVELTQEEYERLSTQPGWTVGDDEDEDEESPQHGD